MKLSLLLCSVGAATASSAWYWYPGGGSPVYETAVQVLSDRLEPLAGATIRLSDGTTDIVAVADREGATRWFDLPPSPGQELVLVEAAVEGGIALGSIQIVDPPGVQSSGLDVVHTIISRTQFLATPILVEGEAGVANHIFPPSGYWPHWTIAVPQDSPLRFTAHVAPLVDGEAVEDYLAYRGYETDPAAGYLRGVVLVVPSVQLGAEGVAVTIALHGQLSGGAAAVDAINFTQTPHAVPIGPGLDLAAVTVHEDMAIAHLTGGVRGGHLALLLRDAEGPPPQVIVTPDSPPTITLDEDPSAAVTDCEPDVPDPGEGFDCEPTTPDPSTCGAATPGSKSCDIVRMRTSRYCRSPGQVVQSQTGQTQNWKLSVVLPKLGEPFAFSCESELVETETWTAMSGEHDLGQCMRYYRFYLFCAREFTRKYARFQWVDEPGIYVFEPCGKEQITGVGCEDLSTSQSVCSRQP